MRRTMAKPKAKKLDPDDPLRTLLEAADVLPIEAARRRGVHQVTVSNAMGQGPRIQWDKLREYARACGGELELRFRPAEPEEPAPGG